MKAVDKTSLVASLKTRGVDVSFAESDHGASSSGKAEAPAAVAKKPAPAPTAKPVQAKK